MEYENKGHDKSMDDGSCNGRGVDVDDRRAGDEPDEPLVGAGRRAGRTGNAGSAGAAICAESRRNPFSRADTHPQPADVNRSLRNTTDRAGVCTDRPVAIAAAF